jgi:16S rRNA (uracil1498-N3)-methyltransferase
VEKSVELGIKSLRLFTSDFSFVKTSSNGKPSTNWTLARMERLKKIVISASEQSKRPDLMKIHEPISYSDLLSEIFAHPPTNLTPLSNCLFFYEASPELPFLEHQSLQQCQLNLGEDCFYFVGSEGGFSQAEARLAKEKGCQIVYLGERVLRVETACIAITSVLKYKLGL